uniref:Uncharacterized protein n=1 Tax=Haliea sp. ETY-M TaxID=1055105 RepID=A0A455R4X3_9GAMM|nr:hypothetical protein [Haliea sp. ETY-M]
MQTEPTAYKFRDTKNLVQLPYRGVSVQPYEGAMTEAAITEHLRGKEAYRRTEFIVLHSAANEHALVAVATKERESLFSPIEWLEVVALPETCHFVVDPDCDPANPTALAKVAEKAGVSSAETLICQGVCDHVNFLHKPDPLVIRVVEVVPPQPPKLFHMVEHVLSYAELPPIRVELQTIDIEQLAKQQPAESYLVPCRSGGLDALPAPVHFLDERPENREPWTMVGCERSLQFHQHYYGDEPPRIEMCPRALARDDGVPTMLKCCLLEFEFETAGNIKIVPWGSDLRLVERALVELVEHVQSQR